MSWERGSILNEKSEPPERGKETVNCEINDNIWGRYRIRFKFNGTFILRDVFVENIDNHILLSLIPFMSALVKLELPLIPDTNWSWCRFLRRICFLVCFLPEGIGYNSRHF